ncbi:MAG: hypothetical protein M1831_007548 [Alyxoria varia]|nr:MAG: hypothetical protein M1831_007548 [Alyxoria varia]
MEVEAKYDGALERRLDPAGALYGVFNFHYTHGSFKARAKLAKRDRMDAFHAAITQAETLDTAGLAMPHTILPNFEDHLKSELQKLNTGYTGGLLTIYTQEEHKVWNYYGSKKGEIREPTEKEKRRLREVQDKYLPQAPGMVENREGGTLYGVEAENADLSGYIQALTPHRIQYEQLVGAAMKNKGNSGQY